MIKRRSC